MLDEIVAIQLNGTSGNNSKRAFSLSPTSTMRTPSSVK